MSLVAKIDQGVERIITQEVDATAISTIAPVGPAFGDIFLAPETHAAITTFSGFNGNFGFVDKFHWVLRAFAVGM
jgi:hypothetical protein